MTKEAYEFIGLMSIKNQLICCDVETLREIYINSGKEIYFINLICDLCEKETTFLLLEKDFSNKIFSILSDIRVITKDSDIINSINSIIGFINGIDGYSPKLKASMKNAYLAFNEDTRGIKLEQHNEFLKVLAADAITYCALKEGKYELVEDEDSLFLSSLNYLIEMCPELFKDKNFTDNANRRIDLITYKKWPFNIKNRKYSLDTKKHLEKVKEYK